MFLVPVETKGVVIGRPLTVFGQDDAPHGHLEVRFENVVVPAENVLLGVGRGGEIAQGRLGPGRVHHCMRAIGMAQRALNLMTARALTRKTFGQRLVRHGMVQDMIAESVMELTQARLLVLSCAAALDDEAAKAIASGAPIAAHKKSLKTLQLISMIKVVAPRAAFRIIDRSIQMQGGRGVSQDTPLWRFWIGQRALRIADGPDEVHKMVVASLEAKRLLMEDDALAEAVMLGSSNSESSPQPTSQSKL